MVLASSPLESMRSGELGWAGSPPTLGNPNVAGFLGVRSTRNGAGGKFSKLPMFKLPGCAGTLEDHVSLAASLQVEQQSSEVLDAVCLCHECSGAAVHQNVMIFCSAGTLFSTSLRSCWSQARQAQVQSRFRTVGCMMRDLNGGSLLIYVVDVTVLAKARALLLC